MDRTFGALPLFRAILVHTCVRKTSEMARSLYPRTEIRKSRNSCVSPWSVIVELFRNSEARLEGGDAKAAVFLARTGNDGRIRLKFWRGAKKGLRCECQSSKHGELIYQGKGGRHDSWRNFSRM